MLTIKRFFAYSIVLHITIFIAALLIVSPVKGKRGEEFFARLISPEEFLPSAPPVRPRAAQQHRTTQPRTSMPAPEIKKGTQTVPRSGITFPQPLSPPASPSQRVEGGSNISSPEMQGATRKPALPMPSTREKLFDRSIIGDIAKREIKKEEKEDRTFSFDVKEMRYLAYLRKLKERIESIWIYPRNAAEKGIYGDLIIKFTIKKNGKLGAIELVRTSGYRDLDDAALRALKNAEPFWPLPDEWGMEAYTIEGLFVYTIYGYYVR